ncbi:hypothetical protein E2P81_ATG00786 [Venturia nashicola]|uniref:Uncharacterized protein n=1 Tax=Venturia nashicola TaxID=86259 RepID=A0A4Z1PKD1_9PEZI|nr:hypothetical protein E6O75_ATG00804 [Venturia nashicola]TLD38243.1 hypothetical protein E2P81_ATG00786 [Venturia nashicola]
MGVITELPYSLHSRYASIAIAWTVIIIPPVFLNLGLFYGLWYGTRMDRMLVLTLPTAILGIFTIIAIFERVWKLIRPSPEYRPSGSPRYGLDIFQWGYFLALACISTLITSTLSRDDRDDDNHAFQIRLLSLPAALLMFLVATLTFLSLLLNWLALKIPFRFGSVDKNNILRPAIFYIVEDVVAVDGEGGVEYRRAFNSRYEESHIFSDMIWELSVAWMVGFYLMAILVTALVMKLPVAAVYAVGWAAPFPVAGLMAMATIYFVKDELRREREEEEYGEIGEGLENESPDAQLLNSSGERTPLLSGSR